MIRSLWLLLRSGAQGRSWEVRLPEKLWIAASCSVHRGIMVSGTYWFRACLLSDPFASVSCPPREQWDQGEYGRGGPMGGVGEDTLAGRCFSTVWLLQRCSSETLKGAGSKQLGGKRLTSHLKGAGGDF